MYINSDALLYALLHLFSYHLQPFSSLQIFDTESHASIQSAQTKEDLSLFGILNNTRTYLGRNLLYQWMIRPSTSLSTIASRHDALECFLRVDNLGVADAMHGHVKGVGNMPRTLSLLRTGKGGVKEWQAMVKVM